MKHTLTVAAIALVLSACAGGNSAVTVEDVTFDVDDIPIETESATVDLEVFRDALNWVVRDQILMSAAADEFGISFPGDELAELASSGLASLTPAAQQDPRANLDYFLIQARVGRFMLEGLLWPELESRLPESVSPSQWAVEKLTAAEVDVDARFGEWRVSPDPRVYEP